MEWITYIAAFFIFTNLVKKLLLMDRENKPILRSSYVNLFGAEIDMLFIFTLQMSISKLVHEVMSSTPTPPKSPVV